MYTKFLSATTGSHDAEQVSLLGVDGALTKNLRCPLTGAAQVFLLVVDTEKSAVQES